MSKPATRPQSRYSTEAVRLLGQMIRRARIERKMTTGELAERAGASRGLIQRIEKGDPGCSIGAVFEAAAIAGVKLFDAGQSTLTNATSTNTAMLALLPRVVRTHRTEPDDDF